MVTMKASVASPDSSVISKPELEMKQKLEALQSEEQRRVLDTVSAIRKCGLDTVLSLPQIVVCGDQSSGKSSVLEALTEIPFPRADNLCTRFATEICLRRDAVSSLTIKVIPDSSRSTPEQEEIKKYAETITDFEDLPVVMETATKVMGIGDTGSAFAKDILSIEIAGPDRPHLTLVDIPGLIQSSTKGVSETDVAMVGEITDRYIAQPRTICLAVISATNDAANQSILERVRKVDPLGERTLGVITKPDRLDAGSGSETKFLELARNEDVFFKLGWHVVKNRAFNERDFSIEDRNNAEQAFFMTSNFRDVPKDNVGIATLRVKLSQLLLEHVKNELPRLRADLENALTSAQKELRRLGGSRSTVAECRAFLAELNMSCYELCKAGLGGNYESEYFQLIVEDSDAKSKKPPMHRLRAIIQFANKEFSDDIEQRGHKYEIQLRKNENFANTPDNDKDELGFYDFQRPVSENQGQYAPKADDCDHHKDRMVPIPLSEKAALSWIKIMLRSCRGTELLGSFNPNLIAELFWEQSERWETLAKQHINVVSKTCHDFLSTLLTSKAPQDIQSKFWASIIQGALKARQAAAHEELGRLSQDRKDFPINYNHYYTDSIHKKRQTRLKEQLTRSFPNGSYKRLSTESVIEQAIHNRETSISSDMEEVSCEEAMDSLEAIYKVQLEIFVANVVTQVIERHIVRGLHDIFSPMVAISMPDAKVESLLSEPAATKRERTFLTDRIKKLEDGEEIFRSVMGF